MRSGSFRVRRAFGEDVKIHWTFLLLLLFFAGSGYARSGNLFGALLATGLVAVLFIFVVRHEYGHSPGRFHYIRDLMKTKFPILSPAPTSSGRETGSCN
jgi:hypothetical protein